MKILSFHLFSLYSNGGGSRILRRLYQGRESQVISFVVNDGRETVKSGRAGSLHEIMNLSVNEMLGRTILTSGATALSLLGLLIFGVGTIWDFSAAMLVGMVLHDLLLTKR